MKEVSKKNSKKFIKVYGSREHNLKDLSVNIPKEEITVITGLSGSGKSSLAFDTIYAEGQRRYVESLSAYARQFLEMMQNLMLIKLKDYRQRYLLNKRPLHAILDLLLGR